MIYLVFSILGGLGRIIFYKGKNTNKAISLMLNVLIFIIYLKILIPQVIKLQNVKNSEK